MSEKVVGFVVVVTFLDRGYGVDSPICGCCVVNDCVGLGKCGVLALVVVVFIVGILVIRMVVWL